MTQQCIKEFNVIFRQSITGPDPDKFVPEDNTIRLDSRHDAMRHCARARAISAV